MRYTTIMFILISAGVLLSNVKLCGQTTLKSSRSMSRVIKIDSLFKCYGVIFDSSYNPPIEIRNVKERFTPSEADIITAEKIFAEQYNATNQRFESRKGARFISNVKDYFQKFNRQYIGYIDKTGNRNLIMHLFDYGKKRTVRKYIGDSWKSSFVIVLADNLPFEIVTYRVNLTEGKLNTSF